MVKGIGIDMVEIGRVRRILDRESGSAFERRTFTEAEQAEAKTRPDAASYYAARFAAKEAVFKAIGPLTPSKSFDLRIVETLNREDGSPYVNCTEQLIPLLDAAGVTTLHISITDEGDYAAAFVVACGE